MHSYRVKQLSVEKQGLAHVIIAASKVVRANVSVNLPKHHTSEKMLDSIAGCIAVVTTALQSCCNRVAIAYSLQMTCVHLSMASKATSEQDLLLISQRSATCIMFFQRQNNLAAHVTSPRANCGRRDYAPLWLLIQHGVDALHMGNVQLIVNNGLNVLH